MEYDIERVDKWVAPECDGAPLLTMPNIPKPLHNLAPRVIEGQAKWNLMRTKCYMDANYTCQICGKVLGAGKCQAHEVYSVDYVNKRSKFERCVCICSDCHTKFIHSGRAMTCYHKHEKGYEANTLLKVIKPRLKLIYEWNREHPDSPIRVFGAILELAKDPDLGKWLEPMFNQYDVKFYTPVKANEDKKNWGDWRLEYKGKLYEPIYKTAKEWQEAMKNEK